MREIIFEVTEAPEGGYEAKALGQPVFTQGDDWYLVKRLKRQAPTAVPHRSSNRFSRRHG